VSSLEARKALLRLLALGEKSSTETHHKDDVQLLTKSLAPAKTTELTIQHGSHSETPVFMSTLKNPHFYLNFYQMISFI